MTKKDVLTKYDKLLLSLHEIKTAVTLAADNSPSTINTILDALKDLCLQLKQVIVIKACFDNSKEVITSAQQGCMLYALHAKVVEILLLKNGYKHASTILSSQDFLDTLSLTQEHHDKLQLCKTLCKAYLESKLYVKSLKNSSSQMDRTKEESVVKYLSECATKLRQCESIEKKVLKNDVHDLELMLAQTLMQCTYDVLDAFKDRSSAAVRSHGSGQLSVSLPQYPQRLQNCLLSLYRCNAKLMADELHAR